MHKNVKSIVRNDAWQWFLSPHLAKTKALPVREDFTVLTDGDISLKCSVGTKPPISNVFRFNHYHTRSMEDWVRRYADNGFTRLPEEGVREFKHRDHHTVQDGTIQKFSPALKKLLE
jgi:hypothetical protein